MPEGDIAGVPGTTTMECSGSMSICDRVICALARKEEISVCLTQHGMPRLGLWLKSLMMAWSIAPLAAQLYKLYMADACTWLILIKAVGSYLQDQVDLLSYQTPQ